MTFNRSLLRWIDRAKRIPRTLATIRSNRDLRKGTYTFKTPLTPVPDNDCDTRVTVVGDRAFAFTRNVRSGNLRASGSGDIVHDIHRMDRKYLEIAFDVTRKVSSQSTACDFVLEEYQ